MYRTDADTWRRKIISTRICGYRADSNSDKTYSETDPSATSDILMIGVDMYSLSLFKV